MGFGHRVYRAEDPRSRMLKRTAKELGSPHVEIGRGARAGRARRRCRSAIPSACWRRTSSTTRRSCSTSPRSRPTLAPAMFACSRVAGWSAHILEQKRTGRLFRPSARYVGPGGTIARIGLVTLAEAAASADELAKQGKERELADLRRQWDDELEARGAQPRTTRSGRSPTARSASSASARRASSCGAAWRTRAPPAAARRCSRSSCCRAMRPARQRGPAAPPHASRTPTTTQAVRRLAIVCLRNGSPQRDTIVLLQGLADEDGLERDLRETASKVATALQKRANVR